MKKIDLEFKVNRLITLDFSLREHPLEDIEDKINDINLSLESSFQPVPSKNVLLVDIILEASFEIEKKSIQLFNLNNRVVFELKDISPLLNKKNSEELDKNFLTTLASIAYSTTRGTLNEKLRGSRYNNFILPVIDPKTLLPDTLEKITEAGES